MVALSRLKATFEACFGLFRQSMHENIGLRLGKEWHAESAPPREAHRVTSKDVRATLYCTTWRSDCGKCTSEDHLSQYACRQSGPEAGRKQVFWEVTVAWAKAYGQARVIMWVMPFTGFSTNSALTLLILCEHSKPQPTWCTLPLLLYSTQHLHPFTGRNSCGHSPFIGLYEDGAS